MSCTTTLRIHYSFIIDTLLLYQKWKKLGMVTDVFGLYLYEKNGIVERFSLISASEERLEKIFCFKIFLLYTEIFSKRRKIYSWMCERLEMKWKGLQMTRPDWGCGKAFDASF